jgi:hypothetical protein
LTQDQAWGIETGSFLTARQRHPFTAGSNGSQILARPFIQAGNGSAAAELVSFPGMVAGSAVVDPGSDSLVGTGVLLRRVLCQDCGQRISFLGGYRFLHLNEDLHIQENLTSLEVATRGTRIVVTDLFSTHNEFHGGDLGIQGEFWRGRYSLEVLGKLAIGNVYRRVNINGSTEVTVPGFATLVGPGGLLALPSNIGSFSSNAVALVPELGVTVGCQITPRVRATLGYTALWWPHIARPGDQVDPVVNPTLLPPAALVGPARPLFALHDSTLWVQALQLGIEFRY